MKFYIHPHDQPGGGEKKPTETETPEPGSSEEKPATDEAGKDSVPGEKTEPGAQDPPAPDPGKTETTPVEQGDEVTEDDVAKATPKVAADHRRVKRENAGLQSQVDSMQKAAEEAPVLREKVDTLERENLILRLAGKHGLDPNLLRPIKGTEDEIEKWISTYVADSPESAKTSTVEPTPSDDGGGNTKVDDENKDEEPEIPKIDTDHPPSKGDGEKKDVSHLPMKEQAEYHRQRI